MDKERAKVAIAGANGFVGRYLIDTLIESGYSVVALSRKNREHKNREHLTWVICDLFSRKDTLNALEGCDVAFYLTHSMSPAARLSQGNFSDYDLVLADNFAISARRNGVSQIIYLGGIIPDDFSLSRHLLSRLEVERTLATSLVPVTSLRAGLILGPEGSSFRIMYNLVKRLPVMVCPSWTTTLSNPISIWDTIKYLMFCIGNKDTYHQKYDIGGGSTISYREMMKVLGEKLGRKRMLMTVPLFSPGLSKLWVTKVTGAPKDLVYPLIGSLKTHMVPSIHSKVPGFDLAAMSYGESIDKILEKRSDLEKIPKGFRHHNTLTVRDVRSIQRLETLYRFTAEEVADEYFRWLGKLFPLIRVKQTNPHIRIFLRGFSRPVIELTKARDMSSPAYYLLFITGGLLSQKTSRGRLIFRTIIEGRYTMVEIHDFMPSLPWYIYKYTQALIHLVTINMFNRHLLSLNRNLRQKNFRNDNRKE